MSQQDNFENQDIRPVHDKSLLAGLFLEGGLKVDDVYEAFPFLRDDTGWGRGIKKLLEIIGIRVFAEQRGIGDNCSEGERHALFLVGAGPSATHWVDARWNNYHGTGEQIEGMCGNHNRIKAVVRPIPKDRKWSVSVTVEGWEALKISSEGYAGLENVTDYRKEIVEAAQNLLAFIGTGEEDSGIDIEP